MITAEFSDTDPFYYWPQNITIADDGDAMLELSCMIHDCDNGPFLVIQGYHFSDRTHSELVEAKCKKVDEMDVGIWFLHMKLTLNETRNYVNMTAGEEPIPIWCRTGDDNSPVSYIHIIVSNPEMDNNSIEGGCSNITNGTADASSSRAPQTLPSIILLTLSVLLTLTII